MAYKVVTVEEMRAIEKAGDAGGLPFAQMMENAGRAAAERVKALLQEAGGTSPAVTILVGPGNNGGDGLVTGRILAEETGALVRFYLAQPRGDDDPIFQPIRERGLFVADAENDQRFRVLTNLVASSTIVVDALYGIGTKPPLRPEAAKLLRAVRQGLTEADTPEPVAYVLLDQLVPQPRTRRPYLFAIDCPSGLDCDTGELDGAALHADETITFIAAKPGLLTFPGAGAVGHLTISGIGFPPNIAELKNTKRAVMSAEDALDLLPARPADANKGTFGKALIVGGSAAYTGAPFMAAQAAYTVGAGLITIAAPRKAQEAIGTALAEAIWQVFDEANSEHLVESAADTLAKRLIEVDAALIGIGVGQAQATATLLQTLFAHEQREQFAPLVVDADALNLLANMPDSAGSLPPNSIITPHPGEMARLTKTDVETVQKNRWQLALDKAAEWRCIVVLKGAHTLVASPDGEVWAIPFKTSALAKAGTGDVLGGMITGLLAQKLKPFDAARLGVYLHGAAGVAASKAKQSVRVVLATDVMEALGNVFATLEGERSR